jgi:hypothetical protein
VNALIPVVLWFAVAFIQSLMLATRYEKRSGAGVVASYVALVLLDAGWLTLAYGSGDRRRRLSALLLLGSLVAFTTVLVNGVPDSIE